MILNPGLQKATESCTCVKVMAGSGHSKINQFVKTSYVNSERGMTFLGENQSGMYDPEKNGIVLI